MIIILMFISAMALFASVMFINQRTPRIVSTVIFGILFVGSTTLMTLNYSHHFGMRQVTTTTNQKGLFRRRSNAVSNVPTRWDRWQRQRFDL